MQRYAHSDVNLARKNNNIILTFYDLDNDFEIKNPALHQLTPFSVYYELLMFSMDACY